MFKPKRSKQISNNYNNGKINDKNNNKKQKTCPPPYLHPHPTLAKVPPENLLALQKYMDHPEWPTPGRLNAKGDNLVVTVLAVLGRWVTAVIRYCELVADQGGPPPQISRRYPAGLFASCVEVHDPAHDRYEALTHKPATDWLTYY